MREFPFAELLRPELRDLTPYAPHSGDYAIRLDSNEAPDLLSERAKARLLEVSAETAWRRYPDPAARALRSALAAHSGVTPAEVVAGAGSDELIALLLTALSSPKAEHDAPVVLTTTPTFVMYQMSARVRGQRVLEVPLDADWDLSESGIRAAVRVTEPNLVFIASPNNPTGNLLSRSRIVTLIEALPRSLVVIDEAYVDYADGNQLDLYRQHPNVAILRTLSKVGFAALRVGWLIARPALVRELDKVRLPYNLSSPSQALATLAVTELAGELKATVEVVVRERARLSAKLAELGFRVTASQANFLWVQTATPAADWFDALKQRGILVRSFHPRGGRLSHQLRLTVGAPVENDALLAAFGELLHA